MSPRRSSRARSAANHSNSHPSSSSHSSTSSTRRSRQKSRYTGDPTNGLTRADSYDDADEPVDEDMEDNYSGNDEDEGETRCVCGFKEYQGGSDDSQTDVTDGLFIQCDQCHVWQHGLCVGIRDKALAPDNYFCEQCKPENHTLYEKKGGRTYSTYIGFGPEPLDALKDHPTKRRSTMNSLNTAYDELLVNPDKQNRSEDRKSAGPRSRKRGTSETSDEHHTKRQRTSDSPEKIETSHANDDPTDKDVSNSRKGRNGTRAVASATPALPSTQSGSKRSSGRAKGAERDNRRDESEQSEEPPRSARTTTGNNSRMDDPLPTISTPALEVPDTPSMTHKRSARNRRRGNTRNTRASEDPGDNSPHTMARDVSAQGTDSNGIHDKPAKPRIPNPRTTIQEMRRRVNGISDYVAKTQVEMAHQKQRTVVFSALISATSPTGKGNGETSVTVLNTSESGASNSSISTPTSTSMDTNGVKVIVVTDKPEAEVNPAVMSSTDIMDLLMKKVHHWEFTYGKQAEKAQ